MSPALPSGADKNGASVENRVDEIRQHLRQALALLDSVPGPPEFAARVQAALDALDEFPNA
jgi:hypothetical protein